MIFVKCISLKMRCIMDSAHRGGRNPDNECQMLIQALPDDDCSDFFIH